MANNEELQNECVSIQAKLGLDDTQWEEKFGNKSGLYGWLSAHTEEALKQAVKAEKKRRKLSQKRRRATEAHIKSLYKNIPKPFQPDYTADSGNEAERC